MISAQTALIKALLDRLLALGLISEERCSQAKLKAESLSAIPGLFSQAGGWK